MSIYLNAFLMLAVTVTTFVLLAKLLQAIRTKRLVLPWRVDGLVPMAASRLAIEQTCVVDSKRRLLLIRCDEQRVLLLTGGPADLVVSLLPALQAADIGQ
jgi:flagellar protein FliO/FliZ